MALQITPEAMFTKIGVLTLENDGLRQHIANLEDQLQKALASSEDAAKEGGTE